LEKKNSKKSELLTHFLIDFFPLFSSKNSRKNVKNVQHHPFWGAWNAELACCKGVFGIFQIIFNIKNGI